MSLETDVLARISSIAGLRSGTLVGIGDDAAVLDGDPRTVVALDVIVEGVHFTRATSSPGDIGHQALAVNLSDIAAMGARPVAAFVGLSLPRLDGLGVDDVDEMYGAMEALAGTHGVTIAGGDVTMASELSLAVTVVGRLDPGQAPVLRSGARPGDLLCVTGTLGAAGAGLLLARGDVPRDVTPHADALIDRLCRPIPRVEEGIALAAAGVTAMLDCSDGLALDATRIAVASDLAVTVELERVPLAPGVWEVASAATRDADAFAATGGDDYELIVTLPSDRLAATRGAIAPIQLTPVGWITPGSPELRLHRAASHVELPSLGWEHSTSG